MRPSIAMRRLLDRLLGPDEQHHVGDLDEELARRTGARTPNWKDELWYLREATSLLLAYLRGHLFPRPTLRSAPTHTTRSPRMFEDLLRDLRMALRSSIRTPGVTLVVATTLAVATAATIAMFAVADAAFLRPLPWPNEERLVRFHTGFDGGSGSVDAISPLDARGIASATGQIEEVGIWTLGETVHLTSVVEPVRLEAPRASVGLFRILGAEPVAGRFFVADEEVPGGDRAVVLSHRLWTDAWGADPGVVGTSIELDGAAYQVVGVAPKNGMLPVGADLWRALALGPEWYEEDRWGWQFLAALGRLTPGTDVATAQTELTRRFVEETAGSREGQMRVLRPLREELVGSARAGILVLSIAVGLLLLIACLNIASVLLARAQTRAAEFGLRRALGVGGSRLARQVMLETGVMATLGTAAGLGLAAAAIRFLSLSQLEALFALGPLSIDLRVGAFAVAIVLIATVAFGMAPVAAAIGADPAGALQGGTRRTAGGRSATRLRAGLVTAQIAVALVLLVAVSVSTSTYRGISSRDQGFDPDGVLATSVELPAGTEADEAFALYRATLERMAALPGVEWAGGGSYLPLEGTGWSASFAIAEPDDPLVDPGANMRPVTPGYFEAMGIRVLEGRGLTESDVAGGVPVVVIDRTVAERFWPESSPIGSQVSVGGLSRDLATVVGIVTDVPHERPDQTDGGHVYFSLLQRAQRSVTFVARTDGDPLTLAEPVRSILREVAPRAAVTDVSLMATRVRASMAGPRLSLTLLAIFGGVALFLAAVGVYGILAFTVARRTREIGTRLALGATPRAVVGAVVRQAMGYCCVGILVGGISSYLLLQWLTRLVVELQGADATAYLLAPAILAASSVLAALVPAVNAARLDPNLALRED